MIKYADIPGLGLPAADHTRAEALRRTDRMNMYVDIRNELAKLVETFPEGFRAAYIWDGEKFKIAIFNPEAHQHYYGVFDNDDFHADYAKLTVEFVIRAHKALDEQKNLTKKESEAKRKKRFKPEKE